MRMLRHAPLPLATQVRTMEVCETGPGITGWSKSYDSCCAKAMPAKRAPADYEVAYGAENFDECVRLVRPLAAGIAGPADGVSGVDGPTTTDPIATFYLARCIEGGVGCDDEAATAEALFKSVVAPLTSLAVGGDRAAQFALAECHYNGAGVDEDETAGMMWYKSSALAGHPEAEWAARAFKLL